MPLLNLDGNNFYLTPPDGISAHMKMLSRNFVKSEPNVRLRCPKNENRNILAGNKIVLAQSSKLLAKIFKRNCEDCLSPDEFDLICPDFEFEALKKVLELVNTGKTFLNVRDQPMWNEILSIVKCLQININFDDREDLQQKTSDLTPKENNSKNRELSENSKSERESNHKVLSSVEATSPVIESQTQEIISLEDSPTSAIEVSVHSVEETRPSLMPYGCLFCDKEFLLLVALQKHERKHFPSNQNANKPISILEDNNNNNNDNDKKGKKIGNDLLIDEADENGYVCHDLTNDEDEDSRLLVRLSCRFCDKSFSQKEVLEDHERKHTSIDISANVPINNSDLEVQNSTSNAELVIIPVGLLSNETQESRNNLNEMSNEDLSDKTNSDKSIGDNANDAQTSSRKGSESLSKCQSSIEPIQNSTKITDRENNNLEVSQKKRRGWSKKRKTKIVDKYHTCPVCFKKVKSSRFHLLSHMALVHYKSEVNKFCSKGKCGLCSYWTKRSNHLAAHVAVKHHVLDKYLKKSSHSSTNVYKCHLCDVKNSKFEMLLVHMGTDHYKSELRKLFGTSHSDCGQCPQTFADENSLIAHLTNEHDALKSIVGDKSQLLEDNSNEDEFEDENRKMSFRQQKKSGKSKTNVCEKCSKKFELKASLFDHILSDHQGLKPPIPGKRRARSPGLIYNCELCQQKFCPYSSLIKHIKENHLSKSQSTKNLEDYNEANKLADINPYQHSRNEVESSESNYFQTNEQTSSDDDVPLAKMRKRNDKDPLRC